MLTEHELHALLEALCFVAGIVIGWAAHVCTNRRGHMKNQYYSEFGDHPDSN